MSFVVSAALGNRRAPRPHVHDDHKMISDRHRVGNCVSRGLGKHVSDDRVDWRSLRCTRGTSRSRCRLRTGFGGFSEIADRTRAGRYVSSQSSSQAHEQERTIADPDGLLGTRAKLPISARD